MKDIKWKDKIVQGINDLFYIWKREFQTTFRDQGVLIFFILVPLGYPLLYSFIYDNEVVREVPAIVVDDSHSSLSREYLRKVDATPDIQIVSYCDRHKAPFPLDKSEKGCTKKAAITFKPEGWKL